MFCTKKKVVILNNYKNILRLLRIDRLTYKYESKIQLQSTRDKVTVMTRDEIMRGKTIRYQYQRGVK